MASLLLLDSLSLHVCKQAAALERPMCQGIEGNFSQQPGTEALNPITHVEVNPVNIHTNPSLAES